MNINLIKSGNNIPNDIYVIIEISSNSNPIKYEINKETGALFVDRFIPTAMFYPCNYGYINNTLSSDGDSLDALVICNYPLLPLSVINCKPIGVLNMQDEHGNDSKIISVPSNKLSNEFNLINDIHDLNNDLKMRIIHFFEHYKKLEKNKWTKINGLSDANQAKIEIEYACKNFKNKLHNNH
ncbi:MAG: inorganic diphosphatase [Enterobacterales bacterium]